MSHSGIWREPERKQGDDEEENEDEDDWIRVIQRKWLISRIEEREILRIPRSVGVFDDEENDDGSENEVADHQSDCGKGGTLEGRIMADAGGGDVTADDPDNGNGATNQRGHGQSAQLPRFWPGFLQGGQGNGGGK